MITVDDNSVNIDDREHMLLGYLKFGNGDGLQCTHTDGDSYYEILRECRKIADSIRKIEELNSLTEKE